MGLDQIARQFSFQNLFCIMKSSCVVNVENEEETSTENWTPAFPLIHFGRIFGFSYQTLPPSKAVKKGFFLYSILVCLALVAAFIRALSFFEIHTAHSDVKTMTKVLAVCYFFYGPAHAICILSVQRYLADFSTLLQVRYSAVFKIYFPPEWQ